MFPLFGSGKWRIRKVEGASYPFYVDNNWGLLFNDWHKYGTYKTLEAAERYVESRMAPKPKEEIVKIYR